jgi:predicted nucleotidyltransferase
MKYHQPLDDLLGQRSRVKILRYLSRTRLEMSGRRIAADLGLSPWSCHLALRELTEQGVLVMRNVGRTYLFRLNERNYTVEKLLLPLFAQEAELLQAAIREIVAGLPQSIVSIILYGSVSRREERPFSDVDFLVLVASGDDRQQVQGLFERKNESFVARYGNVLSPMVLTVAEFRQRYREGDALVSEIMNTGQVIYGQLISEVMAHESQEDSPQGS